MNLPGIADIESDRNVPQREALRQIHNIDKTDGIIPAWAKTWGKPIIPGPDILLANKTKLPNTPIVYNNKNIFFK